MDERTFDNLLKRKLENYSDPHDDDDGFEDLKRRLAAAPKVTRLPGRALYGALSAMVILTAVNIYLTFYYDRGDEQALQNKQTFLTLQTRVDSLTHIIHKLNYGAQNIKSTTATTNVIKTDVIKPILPYDTSCLYIDVVNINNDLQNHLPEVQSREQTTSDKDNSQSLVTNIPQVSVKKANPFNREISLAMRNKIERHYFPGLGINLGIHVAPNIISTSSGKGLLSLKTGLSSDWIISPRLSIETGIDYSTMRIRTDNAGHIPEKYQHSSYGSFGTATVSTSLISLPVSLKYRQWMSSKVQGYVKIGYIPYFSLANHYKLNYENGNALPDYDDYRGITQVSKDEARMFYSNNLSLAVGITRQLKQGKIDLSLFYEKAYTSTLQSKNNLQLFGLSAGYWLRVR